MQYFNSFQRNHITPSSDIWVLWLWGHGFDGTSTWLLSRPLRAMQNVHEADLPSFHERCSHPQQECLGPLVASALRTNEKSKDSKEKTLFIAHRRLHVILQVAVEPFWFSKGRQLAWPRRLLKTGDSVILGRLAGSNFSIHSKLHDEYTNGSLNITNITESFCGEDVVCECIPVKSNCQTILNINFTFQFRSVRPQAPCAVAGSPTVSRTFKDASSISWHGFLLAKCFFKFPGDLTFECCFWRFPSCPYLYLNAKTVKPRPSHEFALPWQCLRPLQLFAPRSLDLCQSTVWPRRNRSRSKRDGKENRIGCRWWKLMDD